MRAVIFTFLKLELPLKNFSLVRLVSTRMLEFFENFEKTLRTRGHRALGSSPRAGSVFALVQRRFLLKLKHYRKEKSTEPNINLNPETCEQRQAACIY
jgi:hypothetical protein